MTHKKAPRDANCIYTDAIFKVGLGNKHETVRNYKKKPYQEASITKISTYTCIHPQEQTEKGTRESRLHVEDDSNTP